MDDNKVFFVNPHCVMCPNEIPAERRRFKAVTCSQECADEWDKKKRERKDVQVCRLCKKPSTPEDRALYKLFRVKLRTQPHVFYPKQFAEFVEEQEAFTQANKDSRKKFPATPEAFAEYWKEKQEDKTPQ